jgi:hypothetical protein
MRGAENVAGMGEMRNIQKILVRNAERKITVERFSFMLKDNSKIGLRELGCDIMDCIHLTQYRD